MEAVRGRKKNEEEEEDDKNKEWDQAKTETYFRQHSGHFCGPCHKSWPENEGGRAVSPAQPESLNGSVRNTYITFYLPDAFIQSDIQSSAIQGRTTTEHAR